MAIACMMMAVAQHVGAQDYFASASDYARLYVGAVEAQYPKALWHELPYYKGNTTMYRGRISYHGVVYDNVLMRFDQLKQCVVVVPPREGVFCLPEQEFVDWFEMDGRRFVHDPEDGSRYSSLLSDGSTNGICLYHCEWKDYGGDKVFEGKKYLKTLYTEERYTLVTPDGEAHHVKRASDVVKLFPEQKKQIKQYVKKNRLSFSRSNRELSLKKVVETLPQQATPTLKPTPNPSRAGGESEESVANLPSHTGEVGGGFGGPESFITGIPVLDNDSVARAVGSSKTKVYMVPGVKKAMASVADDQELSEIVVVGGRQSAVNNMMMGSEKFKPMVLKNIPSAFGESDIMKIVLTLPGVTTVGEASSGYNVRGGATDQNLILLNGGTVYNPSHLFGLFTSFNSDAVEDVELFKSSIPVEYGGRISSVLKVTSKEANMKKFTGQASIGALTSKANVEIPIVKEHVSLLLNGRTTYSD